jgi:hypothetical protein
MFRCDCGETRDPLLARGKSVAELSSHCDYVMITASQLSIDGVERRIEAAKSEPKGSRRLDDGFDASVLHARCFKMRAPDVPANNDAHRSSQAPQTTLDRNKMDGKASPLSTVSWLKP